MRRLATTTAAVTIAAAALACGDVPAQPTPSSTPKTAPTPRPPAAVRDETTKAIEVRTRFRLRADAAWIHTVAEDPKALVPARWGIPLMPGELFRLLARAPGRSDEPILQLRTYGLEFPGEFAAASLDLDFRGAWIAFKSIVERHRAAIARMPIKLPVVVRRMPWSRQDLEAGLDEVKAEQAWIESTGAEWVDPVIYGLENRVVIRYEGPYGIEDRIEEHFASPTWLEARWEGPGEWDGPFGKFRINVRDPAGRPVPGVWIELESRDRRVSVGSALPLSTDRRGNFDLKLPTVTYRVKLFRWFKSGRIAPEPFAVIPFRVKKSGTTLRVVMPR
jgi:hypothetical protein